MICKSSVLRILNNKKEVFRKADLSGSHKLSVLSHDRYYAKIAAEFCREALKKMGCTVNLQRESTLAQRWTVLSSPFAHKTARTQFEKRTSRYRINIVGIDKEGITLAKWYFTLNAPPTVQIS